MKIPTTLKAATGLAALAVGASVALAAPEAKAICVSANPPCGSFDPTSPTAATFTYTGTGTTPGAPLDKIRVGFRVNGSTTGFPLNITPITLAADGITGTQTIAPSPLIVPSSGNTLIWSTPLSLNSNLTNVDFSKTVLNFTFPAGLSWGSSVTAFVQYGNGTFNAAAGDDILSRSATTVTVPGPLPILGAASAFGFSCSMRRRIKLAKAA